MVLHWTKDSVENRLLDTKIRTYKSTPEFFPSVPF